MGVYQENELNPHLTGKQQLSVKFTKARNSSVCYSQFQAEGRGISCGQLRKFTIFYLSLPRKAAMSILRPQFPRLHTEKFKYWQSQK